MPPEERHLVRRDATAKPTIVKLPKGAAFGGNAVVLCAGPCSVESEEQIETTAAAVAQAGARVLRGGAFKPRTSPYAFQGLGRHGLSLLRSAADRHGLDVVTEVLDPRHVEMVAEFADMLQIGARNMQNFALLREAAMAGKPMLLKRGFAATVDEWLMAAEYVLSAGNPSVVLCERGIRSFDPATRNLLDVAVVPLLRELTHLPIIVDPSHGTGVARLVEPMSLAAVAAGADAILVEVHPDPSSAVSDGQQSLTPQQFASLARKVAEVASAIGRRVPQLGIAV